MSIVLIYIISNIETNFSNKFYFKQKQYYLTHSFYNLQIVLVLLTVAISCWANSIIFESQAYYWKVNIDHYGFNLRVPEDRWWPFWSIPLGLFTGIVCTLIHKVAVAIKKNLGGLPGAVSSALPLVSGLLVVLPLGINISPSTKYWCTVMISHHT